MSEVKWIKIVVDIFDDEKIKLIESLPDGDSIIVCWFKLLCLAGKQNNYGILMLNDRIPYTEEMLATIFRRPIQTVKLALTTFEDFGMIEVINGAITIPNWGKHQTIEGLDKVREQTRERVSQYRERQKRLLTSNVTGNVTGNVTVTDCNAIEEDIDIEEDIEEEGEGLTTSDEVVCRTKDVRRIVEAWNSLNLQQLTKVTADSIRGKMLKARIKDYGVDGVLNAIEHVRKSEFLNGNNSKGWLITFEWFVKPNNFTKVLEGNFDSLQKETQTKKPGKFVTAAEYVPPKATQSVDDLWKAIEKI